MHASDLFETITAQLIADIEAGAGTWRMPWHRLADSGAPTSADGRALQRLELCLARLGRCSQRLRERHLFDLPELPAPRCAGPSRRARPARNFVEAGHVDRCI